MMTGNDPKEKKGIISILCCAYKTHTMRRTYQTILARKSPTAVLYDVHIDTASITIETVKSLEWPLIISR